MILKKIHYGSEDHKNMIQLRNDILRKPLGLVFSESELEKEKDDILIGAFKNGNIQACCVLSKISEDTIKLRQMAVQTEWQGKGIGRAVLDFAESLARQNNYKKVSLHARETAIEFYKAADYQVQGNFFLEVSITHYAMEKIL